MSFGVHLLLVVAAIFLLNIPFGLWRSQARRLSVPWFLAIHLPVGLSVGIRLLAGIHFTWGALPFFVGAFFFGQTAGGKLRSPHPRPPQSHPR